MPLSITERERLLNTLQQDFTHADKWKYIKSEHQEANIKKPLGLAMVLPLLAAFTGGAFWLVSVLFEYVNVWAAFGSMAFAAVGFAGAAICAATCSVVFKHTQNAYQMKKLKRSDEYKTWVRDYVAQQAAKRKIVRLLPLLTNDELNLLFNLPELNETFKPSFEKELSRRKKIQSTQNITEEFLRSTVKVEKISSDCISIGSSVKTLIV